ncbi:amidohydrolase [Sphingobium sp. C100]|uniref:amidohydrolase family protein n=1 Tax=Sphingobium sp. C100 TaxID=1207055 RepID=UPI0003D5B0A8|nr:amidohydrolase family protein [Sphingobium sp. C100]ETI61194.1 amidohydrolase [Sphingobium sp. C100]
MQMNNMVMISVDDHISEPPGMYDKHLSGDALASAPQFKTNAAGTNYWEYQGQIWPSIGLNAVVGRPREEYGMEPTSLEQLRKGVYDVHGRIDDMNVNGIASSLNFGSKVGMDGGRFYRAPDHDIALVHLRAYNDWHIDEWCAPYPDRLIPCAILPNWNMDESVREIERIAAKGCTAVSISDNPTIYGLPSIHNPYWEPMWKALVDHDIAICLHIGSGAQAPHASMETPIEAWITTMPISIATSAADWLNLGALHRYPDLKIALSEGGIGWIPYFLERADFSNEQHKAWTHSIFQELKPSEMFKRHFLNCFIDDRFGLKNLDAINEDLVAYECDYPHSDSLWPNAPEHLWDSIQHLSVQQIDKITHLNAMRFFRFDPFKTRSKEELTVGALRAQAAKDNVDTRVISSGGAKPLAPGEVVRPVTSGDVMAMFKKQGRAEAA